MLNLRSVVLSVAACTLLGCTLAGCATIQQDIQRISSVYTTVTDASISPKAVYVAANAFDVIESSATKYINYCTPNPSPAGCDDRTIQLKIIPAVTAGKKARDSLEGFLAAHPGALGSKGVYDALIAATATLTSMSSQFAAVK